MERASKGGTRYFKLLCTPFGTLPLSLQPLTRLEVEVP
jgi:hypothetical protein